MLHNDQSLFEQVILRVSEDTGIEASIIEKDYYVTLFLRRIVAQQPNNPVSSMTIWSGTATLI